MTERKYDKATAVAIFGMTVWHDSCTVMDDGVFVNESFRSVSPVEAAFDWAPAYDMDWPGAPNPLSGLILPIPFTARELAACMLDGPGFGIQEALDSRIGYALNDNALNRFTNRHREMRDALTDAYALAAEAQLRIGEYDHDAELEEQTLRPNVKHTARWADWRKSMVAVLYSRDTTQPQAAREPDATPWHLLATPADLIAAFGTFTGMDKTWFNNAKDTPKLKASLHTAGQGGRNGREPLYFVFPVMQWLIDSKRRKGKAMTEATGWRVLKNRFSRVYEDYQGQEPAAD